MPTARQAHSSLVGRTPGSGGYGPSQTDWSKVANPEAFSAYNEQQDQAAPVAAAPQEALPAAPVQDVGGWTPGHGPGFDTSEPLSNPELGFGNNAVGGSAGISDSERKQIMERGMARYGHAGYGP
jgi:hypothetical protein